MFWAYLRHFSMSAWISAGNSLSNCIHSPVAGCSNPRVLAWTILTVFGEITFYRTFYTDKNNNGSYCFIDRYLGLKKHDYFDPYIKATILEYAANNSIPTVCCMVNELIGEKIKLKDKCKYLNRQTIRNIILNAKISLPEKKEL